MSRAVQVEALWNGLTNNSGQALSGGKVYTYESGTTTPINLYQDVNKATTHTNPIVLDAYGRALAFGDGVYKFIVKDSNDVTITTLDGLYYTIPESESIYAGTATGSANTYAVTPNPVVTAYTNALTVKFCVNVQNTGATTLNVNSLGAKDIKKNGGSTALASGDLVAGAVVEVIYDSVLDLFVLASTSNITTLPNVTAIGDDSQDLDIQADTTVSSLIVENLTASQIVVSDASKKLVSMDKLTVALGGTNATTAADARTSLGAAAAGTNTDITSSIAASLVPTGANLALGSHSTTRWNVSSAGMVPATPSAYDVGSVANPAKVVYAGAVGSSSAYVANIYADKLNFSSANNYTTSGSGNRTLLNPSSATLVNTSEVLKQLIEDLITRGILS